MTAGRVIPLAAAAAALAVLPGCAGPARAEVALVTITDAGFTTATLTVPTGTEVRWVNEGSHAHTVTTTDDLVGGEPAVPPGASAWDSGALRPGETFAHRFDVAGTYVYWCADHREQQMLGTVRVEER
jgi:plastocyanin